MSSLKYSVFCVYSACFSNFSSRSINISFYVFLGLAFIILFFELSIKVKKKCFLSSFSLVVFTK